MSGRIGGLVRAWERGRVAAISGLALEACPYLAAANRDAWVQGFQVGLADAGRHAIAA